jgi:hypothetical protein
MPNGKIGLETPPVVARKGHFLRAQSRKKRRRLAALWRPVLAASGINILESLK